VGQISQQKDARIPGTADRFHESREMTEETLATADDFYSGALQRISRFMIALAVLFSIAAELRWGWRTALGFLCGCAIAYLNFHWLKRVVSGLTDRIANAGKPRSGKGIVLRFLLRYLLMGLAAYAIFTVSRASLYGLLAGLFLPVAGIACEAAYEVYAAVARGM
jgi:small-conductance mechanosensitive channel